MSDRQQKIDRIRKIQRIRELQATKQEVAPVQEPAISGAKSVVGQLMQPAQTAVSALGQEPESAVARGLRVPFQVIPSLYGAGIEALKSTPGSPAAEPYKQGVVDILELPGRIIGGATEALTGARDYARQNVSELVKNQPPFLRGAVKAAVTPVLGAGIMADELSPRGQTFVKELDALGGDVAPYAIGATTIGAPKIIGEQARRAGSEMRTSSAERIGSLIGAGESLPKIRRAGQFMAEQKFPIGVKMATGKIGIERSSQIATELNRAMNEKIIDPQTKAGTSINIKSIENPLSEMKAQFENALPPDRLAARAIDNLISETRKKVESTGGVLTPRQAQDLKVLNNRILEDHYRRIERAGGQLSPIQNVKKQGRAVVNTQLKKAIEELDPQVKGINWTEGAALDVSKALDTFYRARLSRDPSMIRGSGITGAAAGRPRLVGLFALTELFAFRPFLIAYNRLLNKLGTKMSGAKSEFTMPGEVKQSTPIFPPRKQLPPSSGPSRPPFLMGPSSTQNTVKAGGGQFIGIRGDQVLFNAGNNTFAVPLQGLTPEVVASHIQTMLQRGPYPEWNYTQ